MRYIIFTLITMFLSGCSIDMGTENEVLNSSSSTDDTRTLVEIINNYRVEQGLSPIPQSSSLMKVAQAHVNDLETTNSASGVCNLHSWSDQGNWSACCYTSDHAQAECMWNKPNEITQGVYQGNGYEISANYSSSMNATKALEIWKGSEPHHDVILNRDIWKDNKWNAIGGAISNSYAVVWFGEELDTMIIE